MVRKQNKKLKSERLNMYLTADLKQHLYNASEHTGTAAAEIVRQALRKELDKQYSQYKDKSSL